VSDTTIKSPTSLPVDPDDTDEEMSRRGFVKTAVLGVGLAYAGAIGYPVYRYLNSPVEKAIVASAVKEVTLEGAEKIALGTALMFKFGARPAMLIHHKDGSWLALDAVCTHLGCTVSFDPENDRIFCACHGGVYDAKTGENVAGPPPKPLAKYEVAVGTGSVTVKRA
jgi:cytochrome b6-f complex iron-sulfur subunit